MRESVGEKIYNVINVILMVLLIIITVYPLLYVLFVSFSIPSEYMRFGGRLLFYPLGISLESYKSVFKNPNILSGYKNTIFVVIVGTALNLFMTILGSYVLSREKLMLRRFLSLFTLFTMYFQGGMIPMYMSVKSLKLTGSLWALIFPVAISTFNMIILRTAFEGVPKSLEESARIDGATQFTVLMRIMLPLVKPTLAVLVLYYGVSHWNSWFNALIYLNKRETYPLQLILREMIIQNSSSFTRGLSTAGDDDAMIAETIKYATIVVSTAPILCLYPFLQKYFVKGVMIGAVKG